VSSDVAREVQQLRAATREAHEAIAGLRETIRDAATERRAVQQLLDGIEDRVQRAVAGHIEQHLEQEVAREVAKLGEVTQRAMDRAVAKVEREFDRLEAIYTGHENPGKDLETLTRRYVQRNGPGSTT
jgi:chromosome segregation ATPase